MKIYCIETKTYNKGFAILRPLSDKVENNRLKATWDDWGSGGKKIGDFVFNFWYLTCKKCVFEELKNQFNGIYSTDIEIIKTEKELKSKNPNRLKWLPNESEDLVFLNILEEKKPLPESSIIYNSDNTIKEIQGISQQKGNVITPIEEGKGLFFSKKEVEGVDMFRLKDTNILLCTEKVKYFCEEKEYNNVVFLEYGKVI